MKSTTAWITRHIWLLGGVLLTFGALSLAWGAQENFNSFMIIDSTGTNRVTVLSCGIALKQQHPQQSRPEAHS